MGETSIVRRIVNARGIHEHTNTVPHEITLGRTETTVPYRFIDRDSQISEHQTLEGIRVAVLDAADEQSLAPLVE